MRASIVRVYPETLHSSPISYPRQFTTTTTVTPLDIPEIIYHILSFIDHFTLSKSVILVCRSWFLMNRHRVVRQELWDAEFTLRRVKEIIGRMPGTARLSWSSGTDRLQEDLDWILLRKTLEQNHDQYIKRQQQRQQDFDRDQQDTSIVQNKFGHRLHDVISTLPFIDDPLRDLELCGIVDDCKRLTSIQGVLPFLTRLKLQWRKTSTFYMDQLLLSCPLLEVLHAESTEGLELPGPWVPMTMQREGEAHPLLRPSTSTSLALRSLVLKNARLLQTSLEDLISQAPHLHQLLLVNLLQNEWLYWPFLIDVSYNWAELHQCLRRLPHQQLNSFHFSVQDHTMPDADLKAMISDICPQSTEWTFRAKDLTPTLTRYLNELPNVVTSLELYWPERAHCRPDSGLHTYLCASPHLLHLKAPNVAVLFELLDIHHRVDFEYSHLYSKDHHHHLNFINHPNSSNNNSHNNNSTTITTTALSGVWKCRNLRTLHFAFHNHGLSLLTSPTHSRILFGYISRVCPQLRDLEIHIPEHQTRWTRDLDFPNLDMTLQGGYCLLTRLRHLERLWLGRVQQRMTFDPLHLNWMVASGQSARYREERRKIVAGWNERLIKEARQVSRLTEKAAAAQIYKRPETLLAGATEDRLWQDLKHLGLVLDVKEVLDEMDSPTYRCWPVLQRVSIFNDHGLGLSPADELMRLFPPKSSKLFR
ncbi:hypothetical protein EC957_001550 [Mortierella hygrophila]|uniref:F-box domain-containing protein n=1 Tax=Mortierella hygrophila TaxID=979708 RepID=A0A9P6K7L7_9FUNG|nr:hypothetical protein EC957_001550 [Mortierella hygrophila]